MFFWLLLLSYPSVSLRVTRYFSCEQIGKTYYLSYDLYTECYTMEYASYGIVAAIGLFVYVIGIPALFYTILKYARNDGIAWKLQMCTINKDVETRMLEEAKLDAKLSQQHWDEPVNDKEKRAACVRYQQKKNFRSHRVYSRLGFIYYAYNEQSWWYEVIELSRKVALNGLVALITPGEASQIIAGIAICGFYLIFVMVIKPYKARSDHMLSASTHASLMATLLCGLAINLELHFLGHRTFPTIEERHKYEMLCIEIVVVGQAGLVFLQFLVGVIIENTCSPEMKHLQKLQNQRTAARKKASAKSKRRFQQAFGLVKLKSGGKQFNMKALKKQIELDEQKAELESKQQRERDIEKELKIVNVKEIDDNLAAVLNDFDENITESKSNNGKRKGKLKKQSTTVML